MVEAGWYHVEGDPPGTVRRWNGTEWIGFAVPDPSIADGSRSPAQRPARLGSRGVWLSLTTILVLTALAMLFVVVAIRVLGDVELITTRRRADATVRISELGDYIDNLGTFITAILAGVAITAVVFIMWLRAAATAARVNQLKRATGSPKRSTAVIVIQVLIFGLLAPLWWGVRAALSGVSAGSPNLFGLVSDTAMAASADPRTGVSRIEPLKILAWWVLWWVPFLVGVVTWVWTWVTGPSTAEHMQTMVQLSAVLLILEALSLLLIIITVGQITRYLTR